MPFFDLVCDLIFRLIRELSFSPHRVFATCFANDRDILVGLEGRICSVNCQIFLTKYIIAKKNILELELIDDKLQFAITYNENKEFESNLSKLPLVPLFAHLRQTVPDNGIIVR